MVYGWFLVSYILAQWRLTRRAANLTVTYETPARYIVIVAVAVVGLLLLPIAFMIVSDFVRDSQGVKPLDFEGIVDLLVFSLFSMVVVGTFVFIAAYGLLGIINEEEVDL
ncbi:MAG TPA: hypothetical protein VGM86_03085 [Thermoanaerobaculia bacterium]